MSSARTGGLSSWDHEDAIWQEVLLGSRPAFMQLIGLSLGPMLSYFFHAIHSRLRHQIDPYDLRQKACVRIIGGFERFHPATLAAYDVWRNCIERRVLARALRQHGAHEEGCALRPRRLDERAIESERQRPFATAKFSTLDRMVATESDDRTRSSIAALDKDDRQLFLWHATEDIAFAEIGRRLGIGEDCAWRRYQRIRERLSRLGR